MAWNRAAVAAALTDMLTAATEGAVSCFPDPPATFNVPAYIVAWPDQVTYNSPTFGVDLANLPILAAAGDNESAKVDSMLAVALQAIAADLTLGGLLVHGAATVKEQRSWRILADVGGARFLAAELVIEIRM